MSLTRIGKWICLLLLVGVFSSCKQEKETVDAKLPIEEDLGLADVSKVLISELNGLRVRKDSLAVAPVAFKVNQGDTLLYLSEFSSHRENIQLRRKYHHEPWLKVERNGKVGWVYGGAVDYDSYELEKSIRQASESLRQVDALDNKWGDKIPSAWSVAGISDSKDFKLFLVHFKEWVMQGDWNKIANHIEFPMGSIANATQFRDDFDLIFSPKVKELIQNARLDQVWRDSKGVSFAGDVLKFSESGGYKISQIVNPDIQGANLDLVKRAAGFYKEAVPSANGFKVEVRQVNIGLELEFEFVSEGVTVESVNLGKFNLSSSQIKQHEFINQDHSVRLVFKENETGDILLKISVGDRDANAVLNSILFLKQ